MNKFDEEAFKEEILRQINESIPNEITIFCNKCNKLWSNEGLYKEPRLPRAIVCRECKEKDITPEQFERLMKRYGKWK